MLMWNFSALFFKGAYGHINGRKHVTVILCTLGTPNGMRFLIQCDLPVRLREAERELSLALEGGSHKAEN